MVRTAKKKAVVKAAPVEAMQPKFDPARRPEWLRRLLLGTITALIVARPSVLGEDPGLLSRLSGAAGLILSMTWLLAAVGAAAWRWWSGLPGPRIHPVEW